jgi:hypothetical protein
MGKSWGVWTLDHFVAKQPHQSEWKSVGGLCEGGGGGDRAAPSDVAQSHAVASARLHRLGNSPEMMPLLRVQRPLWVEGETGGVGEEVREAGSGS